MTPAGEKMLWTIALLLAVASVVYLRYVYRRWRNNPLRIKKKIWRTDRLKMKVSIRNIRNAIVDIDAPVIVFRNPRMKKRKFKIVAQGKESIFPLALHPKTSYDFWVDFTKLYEREQILRKYEKALILVNDKYGKTITKKKVKIS